MQICLRLPCVGATPRHPNLGPRRADPRIHAPNNQLGSKPDIHGRGRAAECKVIGGKEIRS